MAAAMRLAVSGARVNWRKGWAQVADGLGRDWLFVAKACVGLLLTGWLAMRLALPNPGTAMLTYALILYPQSGLVLAKSFHRALGTLVGGVAGFVLGALFLQYPVLLLFGMAGWVGLCACGASMQHYFFRAYGYVLAGLTAV